VDGEDHGDVVARGDPRDRARDRRHAVAKILAPVRGHQDDALTCEPLHDRVEAGTEPWIRRDPVSRPVQRVDHRIARDVDGLRSDVLAQQCVCGGLRRCEVEHRDRCDDPAVHLFGPGVVDVARAQPRLDMRDRDLAVIGGQRPRHRGRGVALHDDEVGPFGIHHLAKPDQQPRGQPVERLAGFHEVEIDVGHQSGDRQDLVEQTPVLRRHAGPDRQPGPCREGRDDGEEFDRFRARAEDDEYF